MDSVSNFSISYNKHFIKDLYSRKIKRPSTFEIYHAINKNHRVFKNYSILTYFHNAKYIEYFASFSEKKWFI